MPASSRDGWLSALCRLCGRTTTHPDARALRILQGRVEPLPKSMGAFERRETWMMQAARDGLLELVKGLRAEGSLGCEDMQ